MIISYTTILKFLKETHSVIIDVGLSIAHTLSMENSDGLLKGANSSSLQNEV